MIAAAIAARSAPELLLVIPTTLGLTDDDYRSPA
jgi:hypothetical protein